MGQEHVATENWNSPVLGDTDVQAACHDDTQVGWEFPRKTVRAAKSHRASLTFAHTTRWSE
eukprot:12415811-Karenia_brevis.AAC.1